MGQISLQYADKFDNDGWEISYHSGARPTHIDMGGRQYAAGSAKHIDGRDYPSFSSVAGLLEDYGCLHFKFPIILGVSVATYSDEELEKLKASDMEKIEFEGKTYTKYEATQVQRKLETAMRNAKDRQTIAKAAGDDTLRRQEQEKINRLSQKYKEFSDTSGLPTKMERASATGYHRVKTSSQLKKNQGTVLKSEGGSGIMQSKRLTKINSDKSVINPMSEEKYKVMKGKLEKNGCRVISATGDDERFLIAFHAEAISDEHGIIHLGKVPSASAFFEEIIHFTQIKKYGVLKDTDYVERAAREIAANRMLLKNASAYGFVDTDISDTTNNLRYWERDFLRRVGTTYDKSNIKR